MTRSISPPNYPRSRSTTYNRPPITPRRMPLPAAVTRLPAAGMAFPHDVIALPHNVITFPDGVTPLPPTVISFPRKGIELPRGNQNSRAADRRNLTRLLNETVRIAKRAQGLTCESSRSPYAQAPPKLDVWRLLWVISTLQKPSRLRAVTLSLSLCHSP